MITRGAIDITGTVYAVEWSWQHSSGDWWVEIETVNGETPDLSDEQREAIQLMCADAYPLAQYQDDCAIDAEYYDR